MTPDRRDRDRLARIGIAVWTAIGIAVLVVAGWLLAGKLVIVVVPLVLALFPAALLAPPVTWLARRMPRKLATAVVLAGAVAVVAGVVLLLVPEFVDQVPALAASLDDAANRLVTLARGLPFVSDTATLGGLTRQAANSLGTGIGTAVQTGLDVLGGLVLLVVVVALYLAGGSRIVDTGLGAVPRRHRDTARTLCELTWHTLAAYTRALFLVALFDAVAIGLGLWALGVQLVLPLAVLVFFGAFVPYAGALLTGLLAVLVALAGGGPVTALAVLALVLLVQQIEGNLVQPLVMSKVVQLSAFTVIVSIGIGAALLGVLGAFLAVPTAACTARVVAFLQDPDRSAEPSGRTDGRVPDGAGARVGGETRGGDRG